MDATHTIDGGGSHPHRPAGRPRRAIARALAFAALALVATACIPLVSRDTSQIVLTEESTATALGLTWELDFYRNGAYNCGLSGNYTFLVMNPAGAAAAEAPLWVYLHGGGDGLLRRAGRLPGGQGSDREHLQPRGDVQRPLG